MTTSKFATATRVAPIDADYASSGMCGGAAEIDALHRRTRGEPVAPHVLRQAFPLEDVSAGESDFLLDIRRPELKDVDRGSRSLGADPSPTTDAMSPKTYAGSPDADRLPLRADGSVLLKARRL